MSLLYLDCNTCVGNLDYSLPTTLQIHCKADCIFAGINKYVNFSSRIDKMFWKQTPRYMERGDLI